MDERHKILIVDDETTNIQSLNAVLEVDYETCFAISGEEALAMVKREAPDLILLDVVMPDPDGYSVCRALKSDEAVRDIPVIFITGQSSEEDEEKGLRLGAVDYIHKPIRPPIVKARIDNHVLLKYYRDQLEQLSTQDSLTGIANRRAFDESLDKDWRRARRNKHEISLLLFDVDHFKDYNDNEGHPAGDRCLKRIAGVLRDCTRRPADIACRIGGEEFGCLLPETDMAGAMEVAEGARSQVEGLGVDHPASSGAGVVTVSVGVATATPGKDVEADVLVKAADQALYEAKEGGRNRVVRAGELQS